MKSHSHNDLKGCIICCTIYNYYIKLYGVVSPVIASLATFLLQETLHNKGQLGSILLPLGTNFVVDLFDKGLMTTRGETRALIRVGGISRYLSNSA